MKFTFKFFTKLYINFLITPPRMLNNVNKYSFNISLSSKLLQLVLIIKDGRGLIYSAM